MGTLPSSQRLFVALLIFGSDTTSRPEDGLPHGQCQHHTCWGRRRSAQSTVIWRLPQMPSNAQTARVNAFSAASASLCGSTRVVDLFAEHPRGQEIQRRGSPRPFDQQAKQRTRPYRLRSSNVRGSTRAGGIVGAPNKPGSSGIRSPRYRAAAGVEQVESRRRCIADEVARSLADACARASTFSAPQLLASGSSNRADQLPAFEAALKAENAKLTSLKDELATLTEGRERAIRKAVEDAPDHVNRQTGFLAQIVALEHMSEEDRKIAFVILLIDFVSFGFELAAVLAKVTSYVPTTYAALLARDAYMTAVRVADAMMAELNPIESKDDPGPEISSQDAPPPPPQPTGPASPPAAPSIDPATQSPKRGRGRPRKNPVSPTVVNGQGTPKQPPAPPAPA